jgi:hypothetical protein
VKLPRTRLAGVGDCGVGSKAADSFSVETEGVDESILEELDEKITVQPTGDTHTMRPCEIQPTPGWVNNGMGVSYRQSMDVPPTSEQIEAYRQALREYHLPRLIRTPEGDGLQAQKLREIETATLVWYPAYYSVGIFLEEPLSDEAVKFVVERARQYFTAKGIVLEQVRLVTNETTVATTSVVIA